MSEQFPTLFSPIQLGKVTVRNRIAVMAHATGYAGDHLVNDRHIAYHEERAKGGVGLIIIETQVVHPTSQPVPGECHGWDERQIPCYKKLTKVVHKHGATVFGQIGHGGRNLSDGSVSRLPIWAPSPTPVSPVSETPHEMNEDELLEVQAHYVKSAANLKAGGFDGVELHGTHGYLLQQFWSLLTNKRTDKYGPDSIENRIRFAVEVIGKVRAEIGNDMVLGLRICGDEYFPMGGLTLDDMKQIAPLLEATGKLDYISVSGGFGQTPFLIVADGSFPRGVHAHLAAGIKEVVKSIPVMASQRIVDPGMAEEILSSGKADLVGMTRASIADPELPKKAQEGRLDEIRTCIACNQLCAANSFMGRPILCVVNTSVGYEAEFGIGTIGKAKKKKRVLVIGGGPGGCEAARVAAERGHEVALHERSDRLGGQINLYQDITGLREFKEIVRYHSYELSRLGVEVKLGSTMTKELVKEIQPDAVVVATGCEPAVPEELAAKGPCVTAHEVLAGKVDTGKKVVIVDRDGFFRSAGAATMLAEKGVSVTILTPVFYFGWNINFFSLIPVYMNLLGRGVKVEWLTEVQMIQDRTVTYMQNLAFQTHTIEDVDCVIVGYAGKADDALYRSLRGEVAEIYAVGDCVAPRKLDMAILEGNRAARKI